MYIANKYLANMFFNYFYELKNLIGEGMSQGLVSELSVDYETIIMSDGTPIQRERQTEAQVRIQVLKAKKRHEKLRKYLELLTNNTNNDLELRPSGEIVSAAPKSSTDQIKVPQKALSQTDLLALATNSAIEKQISFASDNTLQISKTNKDLSPKWFVFKSFRLKKNSLTRASSLKNSLASSQARIWYF
jgi:hypothetical protein